MPVCRQEDFWVQQSTKEYSFESQYELGKELGRGATSCVYKCQRKGLPKTWAVKVLIKNTDKKISKADVGVLLRLDHKNLVRFKEVFESRSRIFIVQELVTGGELFERVVNVGEYNERVAARAVKDIVSGIAYLHRCGYVHRNLKPENLLYENLSQDSPLKIADFAVSSILSNEVDLSSVCGSPGFAAPELLKGQRTGKAVDMWAIGIITYVLLSGFEPFACEDPSDLFKKILKGQYEFDTLAWIDVGFNAKDFVRKLLVVDPNKRLTAEGALLSCWANNIGAGTVKLVGAVKRLKEYNEKRKAKIPALEVTATPRSRACSRASAARDLSPLPGLDVDSVLSAVPDVLVSLEAEEEKERETGTQEQQETIHEEDEKEAEEEVVNF